MFFLSKGKTALWLLLLGASLISQGLAQSGKFAACTTQTTPWPNELPP
jgi:hypothetical protein